MSLLILDEIQGAAVYEFNIQQRQYLTGLPSRLYEDKDQRKIMFIPNTVIVGADLSKRVFEFELKSDGYTETTPFKVKATSSQPGSIPAEIGFTDYYMFGVVEKRLDGSYIEASRTWHRFLANQTQVLFTILDVTVVLIVEPNQ